jgi:UDP:flavonoid glycosyltransferase YjiC (YdhE family)
MAKVMLMSLGSRGDMEPFLAKAEELLKEDHEVALCMPAQFEGLASEVAATWFAMDKAFLDLIESPEVQKITGQIGSPLSRPAMMPHIADQHFWARCIHRQGLGPQGFPIKDLDRGKLESAFKALLDMA